MNFEALAKKLEKSPDHRIMRRLPTLLDLPIKDDVKVYNGIYLDTETDGPEHDKCEIIELGMLPFKFTGNGVITSVKAPLQTYNEPSKPIPELITGITNITDDMVKGAKIDVPLFEAVIADADLIIAHNARFDRFVVERYLPGAEKKCWGCSMEEVPWPKRGKRLEYIVQDMGYFYEAHGALPDCQAGLFALRQPVNGKDGFSYVLDAARATTLRVWTTGLRYDEGVNRLLKQRGYWFNNGDDGRPKAWHRAIPENEQDTETKWLQVHAYDRKPCSARFDKITAFNRYSKRE